MDAKVAGQVMQAAMMVSQFMDVLAAMVHAAGVRHQMPELRRVAVVKFEFMVELG